MSRAGDRAPERLEILVCDRRQTLAMQHREQRELLADGVQLTLAAFGAALRRADTQIVTPPAPSNATLAARVRRP
ncbi:hypothetical protein [Paraburkholderia tropica]|uniref:hypothetical protein n=1 Tax=Paraburkholderia tropica TaxID=92647 RepID=UPI002AB0B581|nr:hypothetical protein [Paraburkholderia tropica]